MPAPFFTSNPAEYDRVPGLYITERNPPGAIRGRSLNGVAVFGPCVRGPVDQVIEVTSRARFEEIFGARDYGAGGDLVGKVWRSLLNKPFGKLYVCRAAAAAAATASFGLEDTDGGGGQIVLTVSAANPGAWGNDVKVLVEAATDADANHFNLVVSYLGRTVTYQNLDCSGANDNLATVIGDDLGTWIVATKDNSGRPLNFASFTGGFAAALDADGYINLGETVASFTSVAGTEGTIAGTDYTAAGRAIPTIATYRGASGSPSIVFSAEDTTALVTSINTALITASATVNDRVFIIWTGDHTDTDADAATYADSVSRTDRVILAWNSPYTIDPETASEIQTPPAEWLASTLSQIDVDVHPGEEATKAFTRGISRLTNPSLAREAYADLQAAGVAAYEADGGFAIVSGVTLSLTSGLEKITRRRSADFLQLSAGDRLKYFVKKKNTEARRRVIGGELTSFTDELKRSERVVEDYAIDQESVNTVAGRAAGREFILWRVKLLGHFLALILQTEIGTGVTIEVGQ